MPTKLQTVEEQLRERTEKLWKEPEEYISLLETASRLYKYSFKDQILIHAQRPDAVACAEYDTWGREDITNRYVKRGSKGIALLKEENGRIRLRYVFDFKDTAAKDARSKEPFFWKITDRNENAVIKALSPDDSYLDTAVRNKVAELVSTQSENYLPAIRSEMDNTFLADLDDLNVRIRFENLLRASVSYMVLTRCGYDAEAMVDLEDFRGIYEFNSITAMTVLGDAVSTLSEQILRSIELTLKIERSKENEQNITENNNRERNSVQTGRENRDLSSGIGDEGAEGYREVRTSQENVSEGKEELAVSGDDDRRNSERTSGRDRQHSTSENGQNGLSDGKADGIDRGTESERPDGMGGNDEQHHKLSGRNDSERTDLRLNTEENNIEEAVSEEISDAAFSFLNEAKERINEYCQKEFDGDADFSDLSRISLASTTDDDDSITPIDVYADLIDFKITTYYDEKLASEKNLTVLKKCSDSSETLNLTVLLH